MEEKREEYLQLGVREYWIVDPSTRQATVLSREEIEGAATWSERVFAGDQLIESRLLPGFQGSVSSLWTDAESDEAQVDLPGNSKKSRIWRRFFLELAP